MTSPRFVVAAVPLAALLARHHAPARIGQLCLPCPRHGACWTCPPLPVEETRKTLAHRRAILVAAQIELDTTAADPSDANRRHRPAIDAALLALEHAMPGSRALFAGSCLACPDQQCTRTQGVPCPTPHLARTSFEALGFDVDQIARQWLGIEIKWSAEAEALRQLTLVSALLTGPTLPNQNKEEEGKCRKICDIRNNDIPTNNQSINNDGINNTAANNIETYNGSDDEIIRVLRALRPLGPTTIVEAENQELH